LEVFSSGRKAVGAGNSQYETFVGGYFAIVAASFVA